MKVFIYEYSCAAAAESPATATLRKEGWAMLSAFLEDFASIPGVQPVTLLEEDFADDLPVAEWRRIGDEGERKAFADLCREADATLVIAPEFEDLLLERSQWILEARGRSLGCSADAIRVTSDKLNLYRHLQANMVPTPPCESWPGGSQHFTFPLVLKPRFGAGSQATFLVTDREQLDIGYAQARGEGWTGPMLIQTFVQGRSVSVSFLVGPSQTVALPPASQELTGDGRFHYLGGRLPLENELAERAIRLGQRAIAALVGLKGYVGVDLVLDAEADSSHDWVIEINPRPTTSYVGLRALARTNLAQGLLDVVEGKPVPRLVWRSKPLRFYPDGTIQD